MIQCLKQRLMMGNPVRITCLATFLCMTTVGPTLAQVDVAVQHFDAGNQRYLAGDYSGAISAYESALNSGYTSGRLYYNLGNAYFRMDELGQAIRYYEKAHRLLPENRKLAHNLRIARGRTTGQFSQLPAQIWTVWWRNLTAFMGARGMFYSGFFFYLIAMILLGIRILRGTRNGWRRRARTVCVVVGGVLIAAAFTASVEAASFRTAAVIAEASLRTDPNGTATVEMVLHEGVVVEALHRRSGWVEVRLPNGASGWVRAQVLAEI